MENIFRFKEIVQGSRDLFRLVNFSSFQTGYQFFRSQVNIHHLICLLQNAIGNTFLHLNTRDALYFFIDTLNVLDVNGRNHIDTLIKQIHHILPAFLIPATFHIGMCQFIHHYYLRVYLDNGIQIHFFQLFSFIEYLTTRNNGQSFQHSIRTGTPVCLYIAYLHIYSVVK